MKLLAIETSCDDTSAAVVCGRDVLSNVVASQDEIHAEYGGVVPELAARCHLEAVSGVVRQALGESGLDWGDLDGIAVTRGPGLIGSLLVGISVAEGLALRTGLPVHGVNHLEGHALSPMLAEPIEPPFLSMVVSGGHSSIYVVSAIGEYEEIASTRDDSVGEAFDKAAKMLGLGYPGGRVIDEMSRSGKPDAVRFPRGRVRDDRMAFSFSGMKTALWDYLRRTDERPPTEDVCASFQEALVDVLLDRVKVASETHGVKQWAVAGGVSANSRLRARMTEQADAMGARAFFPPMRLCTDNAAMIGFAASERLRAGLQCEPLAAISRLPLGRRPLPASGVTV